MTDLQSSLFLVDGFQISPGSSFLGDTGAPDNMPDVPGLGHFRLETCLPESRDNHDELPDTGVSVISINQRGSHISVMSSLPSQTPLIKPPTPPKPANISAKLLDLKRNKNTIGNENKTTCIASNLLSHVRGAPRATSLSHFGPVATRHLFNKHSWHVL